MPIAYDTDNPTISFLNFNDNIFTYDPFATARGLQSIFAWFAAMGCMVLLIGLYVVKPQHVEGK